MGPDFRVGVYYCPRHDDPLCQAGSTWLGRDPATGVELAQPALAGIAEVTAEARGYGFHATLKPPMRLANGRTWDACVEAARAMAERIAPFELPPLSVQNPHGFLALRETGPCAPLQALADACVVAMDDFRAPPSEAELARRRRSGLTDEQDSMLVRYGYPYVLTTWFFHMTLTRRLSAAEHPVWRPAAERYFTMAAQPRSVSDICLFTQAKAGEPFVIATRLPLLG